MTALLIENLTGLRFSLEQLRTLLARLARAIDALVSARAARAVPEQEMQRAQVTIDRIARCKAHYRRSRSTSP